MARPSTPIGTYGRITTRQVSKAPPVFESRTRFRDIDGVLRLVSRRDRSRALAERNLKAALSDRIAPTDNEIGRDTRFRTVAQIWEHRLAGLVDAGEQSPTTAELYKRQLDRFVLPALGELRLREVTVSRVDKFLSTVANETGSATAKLCRTVISHICSLAVRNGGMDLNPTRETGRISSKTKRKPRSLTRQERQEWLKQLYSDEEAQSRDLPDLCLWLLATGMRIGEALAVSWDEIDLDNKTVEIRFTIVRVTGQGLIRKTTKTTSGERTLVLPHFAIEMLQHRKRETGVGPLFPSSSGSWRDPNNTRKALRAARGTDGFRWVTPHNFRKTAATILDEAGLSARVIADQLGQAQVSVTQNVYLGRGVVDPRAADALQQAVKLDD